MTRYFYDLEFIENGTFIHLISIGVVADDGREYYAVNADMDYQAVRMHPWLSENVWPKLPLRDIHPAMNEPPGPFRKDVPMAGRCNCVPQDGMLDTSSSLVRPRWVIANEVRDFLSAGAGVGVELWGEYAAYDHVGLMQLWGRMIDKPAGLPMWTNDIVQLMISSGMEEEDWPQLPAQDLVTQHHALHDACHTKACWEWLMVRRGMLNIPTVLELP